MSTPDTQPTPALGFLTVVDHPQHGLFGGYLILNLAGRPLEFHCTAPIKANRAQQILYGPTLDAFLYGEQIGQTLLEQAKTQPLAVLTDRSAALAVREHVSTPVALVLADEETAAEQTQDGGPQKVFRFDGAHKNGPKLAYFQLGRNRLAVFERCADDRRAIGEHMAELGESFDLAEPFERIRAAIEEAQQAVR
jgi:hypothetical protein